MIIIDWIKKYPQTVAAAIGLGCIWGGLAFWLGLPQMLIASGVIVIIVTIAHACEGEHYG